MNRSQLVEGAYLIERVRNRLSRMAADRPRARLASELAFRSRKDDFRNRLPGPSPDDGLLADLRRDGIALTTVEEFGLTEVVAAAQPLVAELLATPVADHQAALHLPPDRLATAPAVLRWGASPRVLDLMERYFEVPVAYHGVYVRRDMAGPQSAASNLWHLDMEDRRVIKIVVYLTDVRDGDGSFQYVPLEQSLELARTVGPRYRLGPDEEMRRLVPDEWWRTAAGPAGTVLISDTAMLFHKGRRPRQRDRVTLFYDYTSAEPKHPFYCKSAMPRRHLDALAVGLDARARAAIYWRPQLKEFDPIKHEH